MNSDASSWIDINLIFTTSGTVTAISGGYTLDNGSIKSDVTLSGNQITNKYGVIFTIANIVETINDNYVEVVCYAEGGSLLNASLTYFKLVENGKTWIEIDVPRKTHRIEYRFDGKFDVTYIQLYAVNNSATVDIATAEKVGTVMPSSGLAIEVDGKLTVNPTTTSVGNFQGTSTNLEAALNELFQYASKGGKPPFHFGDLGSPLTGSFGLYAFGFLPTLIDVQILSFSQYRGS